MKDRDKFLTEAMGEKYHAVKQYSEVIDHRATSAVCECGQYLSSNGSLDHHVKFWNTDFKTWAGMGKLRDLYDTWRDEEGGVEKQYKFRKYALGILTEYGHINDKVFGDYIWHKDNTANLMYGFLKED